MQSTIVMLTDANDSKRHAIIKFCVDVSTKNNPNANIALDREAPTEMKSNEMELAFRMKICYKLCNLKIYLNVFYIQTCLRKVVTKTQRERMLHPKSYYGSKRRYLGHRCSRNTLSPFSEN